MRLRALLVLALLLPGAVRAQPVLNFVRIVNNWPTIEVYFKPTCNGELAYIPNKSFYQIRENGRNIDEFTIWCAEPPGKCAQSWSVVLSASSNLLDDEYTNMLQGGEYMIKWLDRIIDEAAIITCDSFPRVRQDMTTSRSELLTAVQGTIRSAKPALWDGVYEGIQALIDNGSNPCRAILVYSDGVDSNSTHSPNEIIALANRNRLRVFCFNYGDIPSMDMQTIAQLTGGEFIMNPSNNWFEYIKENLKGSFWPTIYECYITYQASCQDGTVRTVELVMQNYCGGSDVKTLTYRAPRDTSTFQRIDLRLGDASISSAEIVVPVVFSSPSAAAFGAADIELTYTDSLFQFTGAQPLGAPIFWEPNAVNETNGKIQLSFTETFRATRGQVLFVLTFKPRTQISYPAVLHISVSDWIGDCTHASFSNGDLTIDPTSIGAYAPALARSFSIAPNPSNGEFEVALEFDAPTAFSMRVVNTLGQTVYSEAVAEKRVSFRKSISIENVPPGVYFFMLESAGKYAFRNLLIQ